MLCLPPASCLRHIKRLRRHGIGRTIPKTRKVWKLYKNNDHMMTIIIIWKLRLSFGMKEGKKFEISQHTLSLDFFFLGRHSKEISYAPSTTLASSSSFSTRRHARWWFYYYSSFSQSILLLIFMCTSCITIIFKCVCNAPRFVCLRAYWKFSKDWWWCHKTSPFFFALALSL